MASKFMAHTAFEARLLLRPSHQRTVWTVNKLECPIPGRPTLPPILSSRSYSDSTSTPTPPFPKSSGSTEGSQSSGPKDKNWSHSKTWGWAKARAPALGLGAAAITFAGYVSQEILKDWYQTFQRRLHESARESAIYDKLKKGPVFEEEIEATIPRKSLVEKIRQITTPAGKSRLYPLIIGEHGTGKTSLITLAVNGMNENEPKGVVYVDIPRKCKSEVDIVKAMQKALGWSPDQVIDSKNPASLEEVLEVLSHLAIKYKQEYKRVPVLIIDNANRLAQQKQELLDHFQDYAKDTADKGRVTVVFVSSEGRVPRRMMERASWSRHGRIIEIGDVSKEEALQYLKLRGVDEEQAAKIYELTGGRMIHLKSIADGIKTNVTLEAIRKEMFSDAEGELKSAGILPKHEHHKDGAAILRELLTKGAISRSTLYDLVGVDTGDKLLETNIFAYHFTSGEITFQSTVMKRYCEEKSAFWESQA